MPVRSVGVMMWIGRISEVMMSRPMMIMMSVFVFILFLRLFALYFIPYFFDSGCIFLLDGCISTVIRCRSTEEEAMPNQRKGDKIQYSYWMSPEERELLREASEAYDIAQSDLIKLAIHEMAIRKGLAAPADSKTNDGDPDYDK